MAKKVNDIEANVSVIGKQLLAYLKSQDKLHEELRALGERPGPDQLRRPSGGMGAARPSMNELD